MASLLRTTAMLTEEIDRALKTVKLTRTGYLVMVTLQMSDDSARPLGQLSKALLVHPTTVTMVIDQLEKAKLVSRRPHPTDRRTVLAKLTTKGHKVVQEANKALAEVAFGLAGVDESTADRITADLESVRHALGGEPG